MPIGHGRRWGRQSVRSTDYADDSTSLGYGCHHNVYYGMRGNKHLPF
jgi:hypothetical protein